MMLELARAVDVRDERMFVMMLELARVPERLTFGTQHRTGHNARSLECWSLLERLTFGPRPSSSTPDGWLLVLELARAVDVRGAVSTLDLAS